MTHTTSYLSLFFRMLCLSVAGTLSSVSAATQRGLDHAIYDTLLKKHVADGLVDYGALKDDPRLDEYLSMLGKTNPDALTTRKEKVAFWINAYNAYTLKLIVDHYPVSSIMDIKVAGYDSPWKIPFAAVANDTLTLDAIENEILRPHFPDPRIHYALVCAAKSCPKLRSEAYTADRLENQLEDQGEWFLRHRNDFDTGSRRASLSKVYEWYAEDFGTTPEAILLSAAQHAAPDIRQAIQDKPAAWDTAFIEWDWRLNAR